MKKAAHADEAQHLEQIPNIGRSIAADLRSVGILTPQDVGHMLPLAVYDSLRTPMGGRHDPCVLDVLLAAHDFMNGAAAQPWWRYTPRRKVMLTRQR